MPKNTASSKRIANREHYKKGYEALVNNRYETAIREFKHYIEHGGTDVARAHYRLAEAYIKESKLVALRGRYQNQLMTRALPYLNRAIELRHDYADAYALRAQYWKCLGQVSEANKDLDSATAFRKSEQTSRDPQATAAPDNKNLLQTPDEIQKELGRLFHQLMMEKDPTQRIGILEKLEGLLKIDAFLNRNANLEQFACVYADMQAQFYRMNNLQQAIEYGKKAFDLYKNLECVEQDLATRCDYQFQMAQTLLNIGTAQNDSEAILSYREAIRLYSALLMTNLGRESQAGIAKSFYNIGTAEFNLENMGAASRAYKQALIEFNSEKFPDIAHQYHDEIDGCHKAVSALLPESTRHMRLSEAAWGAANVINMRENAVLDHIRGASRLIRANPPQYEQAIAHIETQILKDHPHSIEGNLHLAFIYSEWEMSLCKEPRLATSECYDKAISIYDKVLKIEPGNAEASKELIRFELNQFTALVMREKWEEAHTFAQYIVQKYSAGSESHILVGTVYQNQADSFFVKNQYVNAISCCDKAISYYKTAYQKDPKASQYLAEVYCIKSSVLIEQASASNAHQQKIRYYEEAIRYYDAARQADLKNMTATMAFPPIYTKIISLLCAEKKWSDAITWLNERAIIDKDNPTVTSLLGVVYCQQGNDQKTPDRCLRYHDKAIRYFDKAIPRYIELISYYEAALKKDPTNQNLITGLIFIYYNRGHDFSMRGNIFQKQKKYEEAIRVYNRAIDSYKEALQHYPKYLVVHNELIETYLYKTTAVFAKTKSKNFIQEALKEATSWITNNIIKEAPNSIVGYDFLVSLCKSQAEFCFGKSHYWDAILCYDRAIVSYTLLPKTSPEKKTVPNKLAPLYTQLINSCNYQIKFGGNDKDALEKLHTKIKAAEAKLTALKSCDTQDQKHQAATIHSLIANSPIYSRLPPAASATEASSTALMMPIAPVPK